MIYAAYISNGELYAKLYDSEEKFFKESPKSPDFTLITLISFIIMGKSYGERKESLRFLSLLYEESHVLGLSYEERFKVEKFFLENGRKYGLLNDFYERGIV